MMQEVKDYTAQPPSCFSHTNRNKVAFTILKQKVTDCTPPQIHDTVLIYSGLFLLEELNKLCSDLIMYYLLRKSHSHDVGLIYFLDCLTKRREIQFNPHNWDGL